VTHPPARRGSNTGNEPDHRLRSLPRLVESLQELGRILLHGSSDLSNDDDSLGSGVVEKDLEGVDVGGSEDSRSDEAKGRVKQGGRERDGGRMGRKEKERERERVRLVLGGRRKEGS